MGFLDHSSANIIVDAVLTDTGRQFLARNDGSFKIAYFAFGDDEIDYSIIKKFGRVIGTDKIEKNTPIFEAQSSANLALKYRCTSAGDPTLTSMPVYQWSQGKDSSTNAALFNSTTSSRIMQFKQAFASSSKDSSLIDSNFIVKLPNNFVYIEGRTPEYIDKDGIAYYNLNGPPSSETNVGGTITFTLAKKSITTAQYDLYGKDKTTINVFGSITGVSSGAVYVFNISIVKP